MSWTRWRSPLSCLLPVLCGGRQALLPALSAQMRRLPRPAVQHRELRPADPHDGPAVRSGGGDFVWTGGDVHLSRHMEQTALQLSREPRSLPQLVIKRKPDSSSTTGSRTLDPGLPSHPHIKALSPSDPASRRDGVRHSAGSPGIARYSICSVAPAGAFFMPLERINMQKANTSRARKAGKTCL